MNCCPGWREQFTDRCGCVSVSWLDIQRQAATQLLRCTLNPKPYILSTQSPAPATDTACRGAQPVARALHKHTPLWLAAASASPCGSLLNLDTPSRIAHATLGQMRCIAAGIGIESLQSLIDVLSFAAVRMQTSSMNSI